MSYQEENNKLFESFLERKFFSQFVLKKGEERWERKRIEIILTADCNLKCTYCYLQKHDGLYPKELRDPETILHNLGIFLDWFIENGHKTSFDLFSGEIFSQPLGYKALDLIYEKFKNVPREKSTIFTIVIPSNMTFIEDADKVDRVEKLIEKFKSMGTRIIISASIDGKYLEEDNRPSVSGEKRSEDYYHKLFTFLAKYNYGTHPMVSAFNIERWPDNYKWLVEQIIKYQDQNKIPMMLEVRDDNWTPEAIEKYLKFLDYVIDYEFIRMGSNLDKFTKRAFITSESSYDNIALRLQGNIGDRITCAVQDELYLRMGDLAIVPCHRTMYDQFIYGRFNVEDDKITGVTAQNLPLAFAVYSAQSNNLPECESCWNRYACIKGCLGSQFETTGELFHPCPTVCDLYKAKTKFLLQKYEKMGVTNHLFALEEFSDKGRNILRKLMEEAKNQC